MRSCADSRGAAGRPSRSSFRAARCQSAAECHRREPCSVWFDDGDHSMRDSQHRAFHLPRCRCVLVLGRHPSDQSGTRVIGERSRARCQCILNETVSRTAAGSGTPFRRADVYSYCRTPRGRHRPKEGEPASPCSADPPSPHLSSCPLPRPPAKSARGRGEGNTQFARTRAPFGIRSKDDRILELRSDLGSSLRTADVGGPRPFIASEHRVEHRAQRDRSDRASGAWQDSSAPSTGNGRGL